MTGGPQHRPGLIDTHLHLGRHEFGDEQPQILARALAAGVSRFMNIGFDLESSAYSARLAAGMPGVLAAVGIHPHDAALVADAAGTVTPQGRAALEDIRDLATPETTVAIGEIGLDFYRDLSPRPAQVTAFRQQLALARDLELPVVLHIRDAYDEAIDVLESAGLPPRRGVMHSFAGEVSHAQWASRNGFLLGIGGPVTYKNSRLPGILEQMQTSDIILETDAPWLPPVPHRGQRNEPAYLKHTAAKVGQIMNVGAEDLTRITNENFDRVFLSGEVS